MRAGSKYLKPIFKPRHFDATGYIYIAMEKSMYIFIFEDGSFKKVDSILDGELAAVESGILEIIDISGAPKYYSSNGEWIDL
jgi:hypothetical protein